MRLRNRQRGLGMWGWMYFLGTAGFMVMIGLKLTPVYLSEMAIAKVVKQTAQDPGNSNASIVELRKAMKTRWDVEGITTLDVNDVQIEKTGMGRALSYAYDAKVDLFYNLALTAHFENKFNLKGGGGLE